MRTRKGINVNQGLTLAEIDTRVAQMNDQKISQKISPLVVKFIIFGMLFERF
jgi:hypothetical protein